MLEIVFEDVRMCGDPAWDVGGDGEFSEGGPAWIDDVDEHEGFLEGSVDVDVAGGVVFAFVGEM